MTKRYLITGNAGSGKSTIAELMLAKGFYAVDVDYEPFSHWLELATNKVFRSRPKQMPDWNEYYEWVWNEKEIEKVLSSDTDSAVFLFGVASNQIKFYNKFTKIFLLELDKKTIKERLIERTNNSFGKRPGDLELVLGWNDKLNTKLKKAGAISIDGALPPAKIVERILEESNHGQ